MFSFSRADSACALLPPFRATRRKLLCFASAAAIAIMLPAAPALAQQAGKYFMADGTKTDDLEQAAASWLTSEFWANRGLAAMNAQYAYAWGISGKGTKIGLVDTGTALQHPEFQGRDHVGIKLSIPANPGSLENPDPRCSSGFASSCMTEGRALDTDGGLPANPPWWRPEAGVRSHGTSVGGILVAKRDGTGVHGGAYDSQLFAADFPNLGADEGDITDLNGPGALLAYRALIDSHVNLIAYEIQYGETSGGPSQTGLSYLSEQYLKYPDHGTLQGPREAAANGIITVAANYNYSGSNPGLTASLPYFEPALEQQHVAVAALNLQSAFPENVLDYEEITISSYSNRCGIAKWWCISGPADGTYSTSVSGPDNQHLEFSYRSFNGTSSATPHVTAALSLIMQRYPYLTNSQARDVLLTTATHLGDGSVDVPDTTFGWGIPDLKKAMSGPGQFLSRFNANLGEGIADTWSKDISQVALNQRQLDETPEVAAWKERGWDKGFGDVEKDKIRIETANRYSDAAWATADELLVKLFQVSDTGKAIDQEEATVAANPLASIIKARFAQAYPNWRAGLWFLGGKRFAETWYAEFKAKMGSFETVRQAAIAEAVTSAELEYATTATRLAYLATKTYDAGLTKSGLGTLTLAGKNTYRGDTIIDGGELVIAKEGSIISSATVNDTGLFTVDGSAADAKINKGGVLSGTGKLGDLDMREGSHVAPGHSIGKLTVTGDVTFAKGSIYDVEIAADPDKAGELKSDLLSVDGKAELLGGLVSLSLENEPVLMSKEQVENLFQHKGVILTAKQGVFGQFERVLPEYSYITGLLDYSDAGKVSVSFDLIDTEKAKIDNELKDDLLAAQNEAKRLQAEKLAADKLAADKAEADLLAAQNEAKRLQNEMLKQAVAGLTMENAGSATHNQKAVFAAVNTLGYGNALTNTIFLKERGEVLPYDNLSGETHATLSGVLAKDASVVGNAAQNRIRAAFDGVTVKEQATSVPLAYAPAQRARTSAAFASVTPAPATTALWGEAYGGWAHAGSDGNAVGYSRNTGGFVTGLDGVVADTWRLGMLAGYGNTSLDSRASNASVDSYSVGLYGGTAWDNLRLSLGTALTQDEIDTDRTALFGDLAGRHSASYDAQIVQVFGELGYLVKTAYADLEPFAAANYVRLKTDGFQENGEISNLTGLAGTSNLTTTTFGLRASREFALSDTISLTARGLLGWNHSFGDVTPEARLAFASGQPFSVQGLPVAQDMGIVEAGFDIGIGKATTLGLTYSGQFSSQASDNAVKANLTVSF